MAAVLLIVAVLLLYSIWILIVSASFWVVRVDNLSYLFQSLFDAGRWPIDVFDGVFRNVLRVIFTAVFPLALMTTYPAQALLGRLTLPARQPGLPGRPRLCRPGARGLAARDSLLHLGQLVADAAVSRGNSARSRSR